MGLEGANRNARNLKNTKLPGTLVLLMSNKAALIASSPSLEAPKNCAKDVYGPSSNKVLTQDEEAVLENN